MDIHALSELHTSLQAQGYNGDVDALRDLLAQVEENSVERRTLSHWLKKGTAAQVKALEAAFNHARKRGMQVNAYDNGDMVELVLTHRRVSNRVCLGRVEVYGWQVLRCYYRGNEFLHDRIQPL
jgi:hypothetical protein